MFSIVVPFSILLVGVEVIVGLLFIPSDQVVDAFSTARDVRPAVHHADLLMETVPTNDSTFLVLSHQQANGFAGCTDKVVFFRFGKYGHVARENLGDAANSGAYDEQIAAGSLYQDGSKGLGQAGMQVYVTSNHDVAHFFVTYRTQKSDAVVKDMAVEHLFEIDGFWTGTSDYKTHVRMRSENAWDGSNEEIGAFVVEQTRDDNDGDSVIGTEWLGGLGRRRWQSRAHRRLGGILGM